MQGNQPPQWQPPQQPHYPQQPQYPQQQPGYPPQSSPQWPAQQPSYQPQPQPQWQPPQSPYPQQPQWQPPGYPPYQPPQWQPQKKPGFLRSIPRRTKILGCSTLFLVFIISMCALLQPSVARQMAADATATAMAPTVGTSTAKPVALLPLTPVKATPAPKPTTPPAANSSALTATHGRPQIGSPESDFAGKYGQSTSQGIGGSDNYSDGNQILNVTINNGRVTSMNIIGDPGWSDSQTKTYCMQFLPSDATEFNAVSNLTDYHSGVGEIVLNVVGQGSALLYIAPSP